MAFDVKRALAGTKALPAHPAFMGVEPVGRYAPGSNGRPREDAVISQRTAARHAQAYGGGEAIDWVFDSIGLYSDPISSAPYYLKRKDGTKLYETKTKGTPPDWEKGPQGLYDLLRQPNPFMLYDELLSLLVIDLMLVGNHYWYKWQQGKDGKPLALYRLAPSHVKIKPGPYGPKAYEYQPPGQRNPLKIKPEDIVHFKRPNPHDNFYGMGVIQGAGRAMDLEIALTDTMTSYYENKADPSLIVQSERRVPRDVFNKLRAQLRGRASGTKNAGELLVLEAGLKASTLSPNAATAMFNELSQMSRDRIFTKFRANPMLFGIMDESGGSNKVSDARREFDNYVLRPFIERLARQISVALTQLWDVDLIINHRQILPPEEAIKVGESVAKVPGVKVREVRAQYSQFGIEESTGDPELDETVMNKPMGDLGPDGRPVDPSIPSGADPNLSSEPGRPPKPENVTAVGVASGPAKAPAKTPQQKAMEAVEALMQAAEGKSVPAEKQAPDNRLPGEQRPDDTYSVARRADIDAAQAFITAGLRDASKELERGLLDHVEGKALKTTDLVSRIRRSPSWTTFKKRVEGVLGEGARRAAASGAMHTGLAPEDDIDYDEIVKTVIHRPDGLRGIISTLKDRAVGRVKDARDAHGERSDFETAIRAVIAEWADRQAFTIADTEATHAYNEATLTVAEAAGVQKVYVTDGDEDDEPCVEANGSVWDIKQARENRIEHPNCRRAFLPIGAVA